MKLLPWGWHLVAMGLGGVNLVVVHCTPRSIPIHATMYTLLSVCYVHCCIYVAFVLTSGQSVLWKHHLKVVLLQCFHAHFGAAVLAHLHQTNAEWAYLLTLVLVAQLSFMFATHVMTLRRMFLSPLVLRVCTMVGTGAVLLFSSQSLESSCGMEAKTLSDWTRVTDLRYPLYLFFLPDALHTLAVFVSETVLCVCV
jgi:hypothetical protein